MGQEGSKEPTILINKDWKIVAESEAHPFYRINPFCERTFFNELIDEYVEEYIVTFSSEDEYKSYARQIEERMELINLDNDNQKNFARSTSSSSSYIYPVKQFVHKSDSSFCSSTYEGLLFMEKVQLRLKEINDIPLADQLYLLRSTLEGFQILYEKAGYFDICEEMIFISKEGKVRVWLNPNLSKNEPFSAHLNLGYNQVQQLHGSQSQMIVKLIRLIQGNTCQEKSPIKIFRQYLQRKGIFDRLSFFKALEELQRYCYENSFIIADHMRSVYDLFHDCPDNQESQQFDSIIFAVDNLKTKNTGKSVVKDPSQRHKKTYSSEIYKAYPSRQQSNHYSGRFRPKLKYSNFAKHKIKRRSRVNKDHLQTTLERPQLVLQSKSTHSEKYDEDASQNQRPMFLELNSSFENIEREEKLKKVFTFNEQNTFASNQSIHKKDSSTVNQQSINQQNNGNLPQEMKFSYCGFRHQSKPSQESNNGQLYTKITLNSHSTTSLKEETIESKAEIRPKETQNTIDFYSPHYTYTLDPEIAQDLKKMLKFQM